MAVFAGMNDGIEEKIPIGDDAEMRRGTGGNKKVERGRGRAVCARRRRGRAWRSHRSARGLILGIGKRDRRRGHGRLSRTAGGQVPQAVDAADHQSDEKNEEGHTKRRRYPAGGSGNACCRWLLARRNLLAISNVVFGEESLFVEAEVTSDGTNEAAVENATGELRPLFVFEGFEEVRSDAGGSRDFFERDLAKLAFTLETFSEISLGHACT